jgi:hypothetical protein
MQTGRTQYRDANNLSISQVNIISPYEINQCKPVKQATINTITEIHIAIVQHITTIKRTSKI